MTEHYSHRRRKVQGDPSVGGSEAGHASRKNKGAAPNIQAKRLSISRGPIRVARRATPNSKRHGEP